jgi:hypothetical protein
VDQFGREELEHADLLFGGPLGVQEISWRTQRSCRHRMWQRRAQTS